jgi:translation elongation factor EF-Tu-like GTPase
MAQIIPHIEVELTLLPTEQSGRRAPIFTGFQSAFECDCGQWDAFHTLEQQEFAFPGERVRVLLSFRHPEPVTRRLVSGQPFRLREGERVIAHGTVKRILSPAPASSPA